MLLLVYLLVICFAIAFGKDVLQLQGDNFELALTSYKYISILFYDDSKSGQSIRREWSHAAQLADSLPRDSEMAMIDGNDAHIKELIDAYGIVVPGIRVFRRGIMADYRGPYDANGIADYITADAQPSVGKLSTIGEMKSLLANNVNTVLFGLFNAEDTSDESFDGYSVDAWGQYQAAADSLRGHASFYLVDSKDVMSSFKLKPEDLPVVYMISSEGDGFMKYAGEILEMNLAEWVLRNSAPAMDELTISSSSGELYATQFFSSRKLKFILFLTPAMASLEEGGSGILDMWRAIASVYKGKAIFSYMTQNAVADVMDYFEIDAERDIPMIAAHQPANDFKYKSAPKMDLTDQAAMTDFVTGVISGLVEKVYKSEKIPKAQHGPVTKAVGATVVDIVNAASKDVLLLVYTPWCAGCRKLMPTFEVLGRAVAAESRLLTAQIDAHANDIPASWGVKSYPTLLWFPAKDKPYTTGLIPSPRPYWDAGTSLSELVSFVQRQSSFDMKSLKVATSEQLGSLVGDEEALRTKYDEDERQHKRNEGRQRYDGATMDFLLGEVVFDGKRWHVGAAAALVLVCALQSLYLLWRVLSANGSSITSATHAASRKKKAQ